MAQNIASLKKRAKSQGVPVIYVSDNFERWRSDFNTQVDHCLQDGVRGKPIAELLRPDKDDFCSEAQTFWILFHDPRDVTGLFRRKNRRFVRRRSKYLRTIHRQ